MKGFRKMDEMEQFIGLKSLKITYIFIVVFLFIWIIIDNINKRDSSIPLFLLISQNLVLIASQIYFKKKMDDK